MLTPAQIEGILKDVKYKDWQVFFRQEALDKMWLQARFHAACAVKGVVETQHCRKWVLSPHMTETEIVRTAYKAILMAEEHEVQENFKYKGLSVYSPHFSIGALLDMAGDERFEVREHA